MDLCTNAGIVSDAMMFMERRKEQIDTLQKIEERIEKIKEEEEDKEEEEGEEEYYKRYLLV